MKIVSYRENISGVDIAIQRDILWPCHAFNITVPVQKERDLNIFEETILKMIDVETSETKKLSELLSLNVELVEFIKSRLIELELISERFELRAEGIKLIEKFENEEEEYEVVTLFINLVSGKVLPVIIQKLETIKEYELEGNRVSFKIGSAGKGKEVKATKIIYVSEHKKKRIQTKDVIKTVNSFRRLYNRFSSTLSSKINLPRFARNMGSVTINETPEEVYLHCKVMIQKGNSDFLVTDPFGFDFSSQLTKDIQNDDNDNFLKRLRSQAESRSLENEEYKNPNDDWAKEIFVINKLNKYQLIKKHLKKVEENYQKSKDKSDNSDSEQRIKNDKSNMVQNLYEVMESTLKQIENDYPSEIEYKEMFASQSSKINQQMLEKFAIKLGFNIPKYKSFLNLQPNMITSLDNGIIRPEAMVALALSKANGDKNHPFHLLAKNIPDFFDYMKKLQEYRNSVGHGGKLDISIFSIDSYRCDFCNINFKKELLDNQENKKCLSEKCEKKLVEITKFEKFREIIYLSLESLYPSLFLKDKKIDKSFSKKNELPNQDILKAKIGLDKNFTLIFITQLKNNQTLYEQFIKIEESELNIDKYANVYINSIYSTLQILLDEYINTLDQKLDIDIVSYTALTNVNNTGFKLPNREWTDELVHVRRNMIKNILNGKSSSLGASLIVFLALESKENLEKLKVKIPNLILLISLLLKLRGHGDKSSLEIIEEIGTSRQLIDLKKSIYTIIKTIKEI